MQRIALLFMVLTCCWAPIGAQDGFELPAELYILRNDGLIERYGLGQNGVQTITPEDEFVLDFGIAPDGSSIAYRTQEGLFLADMAGADSVVQVEGDRADVPPIRGQGATIAWSPDKMAIAYTTQYGARVHYREAGFADINNPQIAHLSWSPDGRYLAAQAQGDVWWIYRRDNSAMTLTSAIPTATSMSWMDAGRLLFTPPDGGLIMMDLDAQNAQQMLLDAVAYYSQPLLQADGSVLIFAQPSSELGGMGRLQRITGNSSTPQVEIVGEASISERDLMWAPGGERLVAFAGGALAMVNPITGDGYTLPITSAVAYAWGPSP